MTLEARLREMPTDQWTAVRLIKEGRERPALALNKSRSFPRLILRHGVHVSTYRVRGDELRPLSHTVGMREASQFETSTRHNPEVIQL